MSYIDEINRLNKEQKAAVYDESSVCLVKANVGSGKTTVLISKILYLHYEKKVPYSKMMVITFTNKAAREIKMRLKKLDEDIDAMEFVMFSTFHSVALELLRRQFDVSKLGYSKDFTILTPEEEMDIAEYVIEENNLTIKYKNRLKKRLSKAERNIKDKYNDDIMLLPPLLMKKKIEMNVMTFDDIIDNAILLMNSSNINCSHIMIDEIQDCDERQLRFIEKVKEVSKADIFAVGDPNQLIYSFRGSMINVFFNLKEKYKATELTLPLNYRSTASILRAANRFRQTSDELVCVKDDGDNVHIMEHYNALNEAMYISSEIKKLNEAKVPYGEIAILYRMQSQADRITMALQSEGIPYEVKIRRNMKDIAVMRWFVKLLRCLINIEDRVSLQYVLTDKKYGEGLSKKKCIALLDENKGSSLLLDRIHSFKGDAYAIKTKDEFIEYFSLYSYINPTLVTYAEDKAHIDRMTAKIIDISNEYGMPIDSAIHEYLSEKMLYENNYDTLGTDTLDSVKLMTLHASKGLEFAHVYIIGANNGLLPMKTGSFEEEDEERRLFYVGITRAKDCLNISYYANVDNGMIMPGPGRFASLVMKEITKNDKKADNIRELRREVKEYIDDNKDIEVTIQLARHAKYGDGEVVREDDNIIVVKFEVYGEKEFLKAFGEVELI